ncbi:MAG: hypothetical protein KJZ85_20095 [Rhodobacteraceae bacterium]|jgi:hypothetical protein|nr:hypothetical protein [Paracoccaceae bacterium]
MRPALPAALAAALAALPAAAFEMTYELFEAAVPHLDLEDCPAALSGPDRFCRLAIGHDAMHVFAFAVEGAQPLVGVESFAVGSYTLTLGE